mgnify:CR=1 FL=1
MTGEHWTVNSDASLENFIKHLRDLYTDKKYIQVKWSTEKALTAPQLRSVFLYCDLLSKELNGRGLDMVKTLKAGVDIPWSKESARQFMWQPIQEAQFNKKSLTELKTHEVTKIYDVINRHLSDKFGVYVPFPSRE